ncbi:MAG: ribonuclease P protein component [Candidatus Levyibacteriota bacterium]
MLPKKNRLPARSTLIRSATIATPYFTVKFCKNLLLESRFAFVMSKASAKNATDRNRAKRIVRSCVEELLPYSASPTDFLFILKKSTVGVAREAVFPFVKHVIAKTL